jgi:NAD(P)-dependent dehydrogenase (short-subunit alcohol dehydrogenase family)
MEIASNNGMSDSDGLAGLGSFNTFDILESFDSYGFTKDEFQTTLKVLKCISDESDDLKLYKEKRMKPLRKALVPFLTDMRSQFPVNVDKHLRRKEAQAIRNARKQRQKRQDAKYIDKSKLRAKRLLELQALQNEGKGNDSGSYLLVPDGAVVEDIDTCNGITNDMEKVVDNDVLNSNDNDNNMSSITIKPITSVEEKLLIRPRSCYMCKRRYYQLHHFYDQFCPECAALNYEKRQQTFDLTGKIALVTGGRVKIGFQVVLKLVRAGAKVIVTTRFPHDCARRFSELEDYNQLKNRISIYGLDFRYIPGVERFCEYLCNTLPRLDIIINNACQTIRRPPAYYKHLMDIERMKKDQVPKQWLPILGASTHGAQYVNNSIVDKSLGTKESGSGDNEEINTAMLGMNNSKSFGDLSAAEMTQVQLVEEDNNTQSFPEQELDINQQQIDLRKHNSWLLKLEEVRTPELLECVSINMMTPFIINSRLKKIMTKEICITANKFIVNVSAMEGKFYRYKTPRHPHTNMAKAAINMMTRTSSEDYAKSKIYMNSIDTGWINDENPLEKARKIFEENNFQTPIDEIDAASRILDPVFDGLKSNDPKHGKFYKDYKVSEW